MNNLIFNKQKGASLNVSVIQVRPSNRIVTRFPIVATSHAHSPLTYILRLSSPSCFIWSYVCFIQEKIALLSYSACLSCLLITAVIHDKQSQNKHFCGRRLPHIVVIMTYCVTLAITIHKSPAYLYRKHNLDTLTSFFYWLSTFEMDISHLINLPCFLAVVVANYCNAITNPLTQNYQTLTSSNTLASVQKPIGSRLTSIAH